MLFPDIQSDLSVILAATSRSISIGEPSIEFASIAFVARKHHSSFVYIHAILALIASQHVNTFFLLVDRAEGSVSMWSPQMRYLEAWAKRTVGDFPPLLVICPSGFRAGAMLRLARTTCKSLTVVATDRRDIAITEGLIAVAQQPKGWRVMLVNGRLATVDPFAWPAMPREVYDKSSFAIHKLKRRAERSAAKEVQPEVKERLEKGNTLNEHQHHLLTFLARNPVVPESVIVTFLKKLPAEIQRDLLALEQAGFAQRTPSKFNELIWSASDAGVAVRIQCEMQPSNHLRRYRFFRADHERRLMHTLGVYRFFESMKLHCDRRSRAARKLDAKANGVSEGSVSAFALKAWESEFMASDGYVLRGQMRFWRPDGYGAVRAGKTTTHFWLELDGTASAPSRFDPAVWMGKLGRLCDYVQSGRWSFRYPKLPRLLIVTTDLRNASHIYDAVVESARARGLRTLPRVFIADADAIHQRGALGKVWLEIGQEEEGWCYAFEGLEASPLQLRVPKRVNVLDELQRADQMGLLPQGGD